MRLKTHRFQMSWEVNEASNIISLHHLMVGEDLKVHTPTDIWMNAHKGDLALALKMGVIPEKQLFHCVSHVVARNDETGEEITCQFEKTAPEKMTFRQFLDDFSNDPEAERFHITEDGFKKLWRGYDFYLERYLQTVGGSDDYTLVTNHCTATCHTAFLTYQDERNFKIRKITKGYGLGKD